MSRKKKKYAVLVTAATVCLQRHEAILVVDSSSSSSSAWELLSSAREIFRAEGYDAVGVSKKLLGATDNRELWAPTSLVRRGSCRLPLPPIRDGLDALMSLYALGGRVPASTVPGRKELEEAGLLLVQDDTFAFSPVALSPVGRDLLIATDFAPPCQHTSDPPCMYLGPDSLALADVAQKICRGGKRVADLCAGSGVQGLVALVHGAGSVLAIEREARAASFCRFNAALNSRLLASTALASAGCRSDTLFDVVLANPPFVAVPADIDYPAFADGGPTGESVLEDVVRFAAKHLAEDGILAVVCEVHGDPAELANRVSTWWEEECSPSSVVVLSEPESPRSRTDAVSQRRVADSTARRRWNENYRTHRIDSVSNGFVFASRRPSTATNKVIEASRLWAPPPTNNQAREAVAIALSSLLYE